MKKLSRISLHNLSQSEMAKREQNLLKGGVVICAGICSCKYEGKKEDDYDSFYGGSDTYSNGNANTNNIEEANRKNGGI